MRKNRRELITIGKLLIFNKDFTFMGYRCIFSLAGFYNLCFALWLIISQASLFGLVDMQAPFASCMIFPLAFGIAGFGMINFYGALYPDKAWRWIIWSLLAKVITPALVLFLILYMNWPASILKMIFLMTSYGGSPSYFT